MKVNLEAELANLCTRNKDGSFATQYNRKKILIQAAKDLKEIGFYNLSPRGIKPKHIDALVENWKKKELTPGTIKNRMSHVRWWAEKVDKKAIVARDNDHYGIDRRKYVTNKSKAVVVEKSALSSFKSPHIKCSVELQKAFGLRREESLKFQPSYAIHENKIVLKASWTKGGKAREIPIINEYQRQVLQQAVKLSPTGSLIPKEYNYREWLNKYTGAIKAAGLSKLHGLRHEYAQQRYRSLTGIDCPACGGPGYRQLTPIQKKLDYEVRIKISQELGHEREQITAVYLGR